jgi:hypothetical protein
MDNCEVGFEEAIRSSFSSPRLFLRPSHDIENSFFLEINVSSPASQVVFLSRKALGLCRASGKFT